MIITGSPTQITSRPVQALVLMVAVVLLPLGPAVAQDGNSKTDAYLQQVWEMLQDRVEAGKMSVEEAEAKMVALKEKTAAKAKAGEGKAPATATAAGEFWEAVIAGDTEAMKRQLSAGANVNARDPARWGTPLMSAALFGQTEAAALLIEKGAAVGARHDDGNTALHAASFFGQPEVVGLLLQKGAEANVKNRKGETPLDIVAGAWTPELENVYKSVGEFLEIELDLELIKAARPEVIELLQEHGAKTGIAVGDIWTAALSGDLKAIGEHVTAGGHLNLKERTMGGTPLTTTALFGHSEAAALMIEHGAELELRNNDGNTALHIAAFLGHPETVSLLLDKGADDQAKNNRGETPLDIVAGEWTPALADIYTMIGEILKAELDLERIEAARPRVAAILRREGDAE